MIVIASHNQHKVDEVSALPAAQGLSLVPLSNWPDAPEVVEDGVTCEENAAIKAMRYSLWLKREHAITYPVIAEDAGLAIEGLLGWPGVESARVADSDAGRIQLVLDKLGDSNNRTAHFMAYTALAINGFLLETWRGIAPGRITREPRGQHGFGYDPIFEDHELRRTFAELSTAEKNARSHRTKAWTQVLGYMRKERLV